jgi:RNA polymerase sigma-70 factor, ECF subfamily
MKPMQRFKELYQRYKGAVFGYLYRMSGSADEAEELTQETFYQAILSLHRFRGEAAVLTWLLKVARNVYLKHLRRQRREPLLAYPEAGASADRADQTDPAPGPAEALVLQAERAQVARALAALPEQYRTALILREVQGLSHAEIAAVLEKTEPTVRVLVHRARQRLHESYLRKEGSTR